MDAAEDALALTPATVAEAIRRIVADCQPETILAFGSRARGRARADSDLDLLVLLPEKVTDHSSWRRRFYRLLADLPFAKDILVSDPEHYALWSTQINSVYHDVSLEGMILWRHGHLVPHAVEKICR